EILLRSRAEIGASMSSTSPDFSRSRWQEAVAVYADRRVISILFLGFSSGLPIMLVASTLSAWLREADVSRSTIGLFAYVFLPYTLKFAWAPLMDRLPLPPLTTWLGRRRGWMLLTQICLIGAIFGLGQSDPAVDLYTTALFAVLVAFFSASQDVVIDAYRVEILPEEQLGAGAAVVVLGYRLAMWMATAAALVIADQIGWSAAYATMACLMLVGIVTVFLVPEPEGSTTAIPGGRHGFRAWVISAVVEPFTDFFLRHGLKIAIAILAFISFYKACDVLLTLMANPFYLDVGFTKTQIGVVSGTFGLFATIGGGLLGGILVYRIGLLPTLLVAGLLQAGSNLMFAALASIGPSMSFFYLTIAIENVSGGLGTAAFVAYLSSLCNIHYTAVQYALLTSFMQMLGKYLIVPSSGFYADAVGWHWFFITSAFFALPGLALILWLQRQGLKASATPAPDST
ncbi:MAG: AmpG family muropeptide MFS transporter, partial [Pseudomonadota bacterium]